MPSCGAVLADWGADVVKVEHPVTGDPQRGVMMSGMVGDGAQSSVKLIMETPNRGKRSIGVDIPSEAGREVLLQLVAEADVLMNPLTNFYRTKDGRHLTLIMLEGDRYWAPVCKAIGRPELVDDPRFPTFAARAENRGECMALLDEVFASRTLDEWTAVLDGVAVWGPVRTAREVHDDPQALANGYLPEVDAGDGTTFRLVATPVRSPEHGQHPEQILLDLGYDWPAIAALKDSGTVL